MSKKTFYLVDLLKYIPTLVLFVSIIGASATSMYRISLVEAKTEKIEDSQALFHKDTAENIEEIKVSQAKIDQKVDIMYESLKDISGSIKELAKRPA